MKFAAIISAMTFTASAAIANETPVFFFNGYSFTISAVKLKGAETPEIVTKKATEVCGSVGKRPELQVATETSDFRAEFAFICL